LPLAAKPGLAISSLKAWCLALVLAMAACAGPASARKPPGATAAHAPTGWEDAARQARAAWVAGDLDRLIALQAGLAGSPADELGQYWLASLRLRGRPPDDAAAREFLNHRAGSALAERLRVEWLLVLAARGDFAAFEAERRRPLAFADDPQLQCAVLQARLAGPAAAAVVPEARRLLANTPDPGGDACSALAEHLLDDGLLSTRARLQALMERNQWPVALTLIERRAPPEADFLRLVFRQPESALRSLRQAREKGTAWPLAAPLALMAVARDDAPAAAAAASELDEALGAADKVRVWNRIGRMAQLAGNVAANAWYARAGAPGGGDEDSVRVNDVLESRARAALAAADWAALRATVAAMPPELRNEAAWTYWDARAALAQGDTQPGRVALTALAQRWGYYGALAAETLGQPVPTLPGGQPADAAAVAAWQDRPGLVRARALYRAGLREEANREWNWELRGQGDAELRAVAEVARRAGLNDRMIAAAERAHGSARGEQRYPQPYAGLLERIAGERAIDPAWVYALVRQESRFIEDVHSGAGALGLMQLMPHTARYVARRGGRPVPAEAALLTPETNLELGSSYLRLVLDDQDGRLALAAAAYNSGPIRVRRWRAALTAPVEGAVFVETIPIAETRDYVKHVLHNAVVYAQLRGNPRARLMDHLAPVGPRPVPAEELP
jgi:soluble lytic murein transglycosylase